MKKDNLKLLKRKQMWGSRFKATLYLLMFVANTVVGVFSRP